MIKTNNYTKKRISQEKEANLFACALLMPKQLLEPELALRKNLQEEQLIKELAELFLVPEWAVVIRLQMFNELHNMQ